ncbi:MAG: CDP-alcohol phosphatidyltransferase family protein [Erysipelotrichaceae bacterium]|nr:CDP-alcohol phosphatidyltransferase family protein [Erysipelotrichaceae bacterium]
MIKKNIANIITITRIIGTFVMINAEVLSVPFYIAYIYAGLSDILDGFLARKLKIESDVGKKLDSISDLFFYTTMMIKIWPYLVKYLPVYVWIIIWTVVGIRILLYLIVLFKNKSLLSNHTLFNKATGLLMFFLPFLLNIRLFVAYSTFVALLSLVAVLYEISLILKNKNN